MTSPVESTQPLPLPSPKRSLFTFGVPFKKPKLETVQDVSLENELLLYMNETNEESLDTVNFWSQKQKVTFMQYV